MNDTGDVTEDSQQDVDELRTEVSRNASSIHSSRLTKSALQPRSRKTPSGGRRIAKLQDGEISCGTADRGEREHEHDLADVGAGERHGGR